MNVGTSGAEIGAAFGGNKVCTSSFCSTIDSHGLMNRALDGKFPLYNEATLVDPQIVGGVSREVMLGSNTSVGAPARVCFCIAYPDVELTLCHYPAVNFSDQAPLAQGVKFST